jgi:hypothetical protein
VSHLRRSQALTIVTRDPRTVEASQVLASFAAHATVQAVAEWCQGREDVARVTLDCTDEDIAACLATLGRNP